MKTLLFTLFSFLPFVMSAQSTTYPFEEENVPTAWAAKNGTLALSTGQFKEGTKSLCWKTSGESVLEVGVASFVTTGKTMSFWLRSAELTNDILKIEFIHTDNKVKRTALVSINYRGWAELNRVYNEYNSISNLTLTKVRFTLTPTDATATRQLWFDDVRFNAPASTKPAHTAWILDVKQLSTKTNGMLAVYANVPEIAVQTPTSEELAGLQLLRTRFKRSLETIMPVGTARVYAKKHEITRNTDNSVSGKVMQINTGALTTELLNALQALGANIDKNEEDRSLFYNLLDHAINQGFHCGTDWYGGGNPSWYDDWRLTPVKIFNIASILEGDRRKDMLELGRWVSKYIIWYSEKTYLANLNSDILYLSLPSMYYYAVLQADDALAVRELKGLARFLGRNSDVAPGGAALVKIDGCGFHHGSHYNNYMYSFNTWGTMIYNLRDTPFNISADKYPRFRFAVTSMYMMATRSSLKFANSLAGRNPYGKGGINIQVPIGTVQDLATVGGQILGLAGPDPELGALYNFYSKSKTFDVPEIDYDGFHQFNYSPIGIARKDDWVVTMRAPTTNFFGAEIYINQNRLGRYQSHGTIEVNYSAGPEASGMPTNGGSGGWDWNVIPGTTTVHYTSWTDMNPGKTTATTQRFDQYSDKDFSGALAFGKNGVFATDFVQNDKWGGEALLPTNLKFKKSVFAFDSILVAIGTDISADTNFPDLITATNLFQEVKSSSLSKLIVDGLEVLEGGGIALDASTNSHWMVTPLGTGYYVPQGNDNLIVKYGKQKSPSETGADIGNPISELTAAKAYISHGKQPSSASYAFVVVPGTTRDKMETLASQMGQDGGQVFTVDFQNEKLHAVTHAASHTTGYAFFEPIAGLNFGKVISTTTEHLMMVTEEPGSNQLQIAICNPNLRPKSDATYSFLSQETVTTVVLRGKWGINDKTKGVISATIIGDNTQLSVSMIDGMPEYATLQLEGTVGLDEFVEEEWVKYKDAGSDIMLAFAQPTEAQIAIYTPAGSLAYRSTVSGTSWNISKSSLEKGLYLLQVTVSGKKKTYKLVN